MCFSYFIFFLTHILVNYHNYQIYHHHHHYCTSGSREHPFGQHLFQCRSSLTPETSNDAAGKNDFSYLVLKFLYHICGIFCTIPHICGIFLTILEVNICHLAIGTCPPFNGITGPEIWLKRVL